jgi:hypothetical protein
MILSLSHAPHSLPLNTAPRESDPDLEMTGKLSDHLLYPCGHAMKDKNIINNDLSDSSYLASFFFAVACLLQIEKQFI